MTSLRTNKGILILGASGLLGRALTRTLRSVASVTALGHAECDVGDEAALTSAIKTYTPSLLINASAYTAVDHAEDDQEAAFRINADAPALMADLALRHDMGLIHYSTDYVFDGKNTTPYTEDDPTHPLGVYGLSKRRGEEAVLARPITGFILRTSWLYDSEGRNFFTTIKRLAATGAMRIVADQHGAPTSVTALAHATYALIQHPKAHEHAGLYHATCGGETTWHGFAQTIVQTLNLKADVTPIQTTDYPTRAQRPPYSVLDNTKLKRTFGIELPSWQDALTALLQKS